MYEQNQMNLLKFTSQMEHLANPQNCT